MSDADAYIQNLRGLADELEDVRDLAGLPPHLDGKLSEAEVNLRGVADAWEARRP